MANQWFKFYGGEYLSDSKIGRLSSAERSCWLTLLCMASMTDDGVIEFLSVDDLLIKSGISWNPYEEGDWEKCQSVLTKFAGMKMLQVDPKKSYIEITNWSKRQEKTAQTPYERVKKHRENKAKLKNDNENDNADNENDNDRIEENRIEENREDNTFPSFWSAYPNKTNKKKSEELWVSKRLNSKLEEILSFVEGAKKTDRWARGFIKAPDVFLRNESWNDDLSAYGTIKSEPEVINISTNVQKEKFEWQEGLDKDGNKIMRKIKI